MSDTPITAIKGFNPDMTCRGFQYAEGKTYIHQGKVRRCESGFHAIEGHPLAVFEHYPPASSVYAEVTLSGALCRAEGDDKVAGAEITIGAPIEIDELIGRAVEYVFDKADKPVMGGAASATRPRGASSATGYQGAASATGPRGAASATGDQGASSATGDRGAASATGYQGASSATGYQGAASATGDWGAASATGTGGAASATGPRGAASATGTGGASSATGYQGAASATGTGGAASATGYEGAASAGHRTAAALSSGYKGKAKGVEGAALFLCERAEDDAILHVWAGIAGRDGVKPDTWYTLRDGKPLEVTE